LPSAATRDGWSPAARRELAQQAQADRQGPASNKSASLVHPRSCSHGPPHLTDPTTPLRHRHRRNRASGRARWLVRNAPTIRKPANEREFLTSFAIDRPAPAPAGTGQKATCAVRAVCPGRESTSDSNQSIARPPGRPAAANATATNTNSACRIPTSSTCMHAPHMVTSVHTKAPCNFLTRQTQYISVKSA
jgi:hypothetical protein